MLQPTDILDFWFGPLEMDGTSSEFFHQRWFGGGEEFDDEIRHRFKAALEHALVWCDPESEMPDLGPYTSWPLQPESRLALIILFDQFPRNLFRRQAKAFAGDAIAQKLAQDGVALGHDQQLSLDQRVFFYLPFEHGENQQWQDLSLRCFEQLVTEAPENLKLRYQNFYRYAKAHAEIIQRFDRYPHRNAALGRESTPAEAAFLAGPGSSFW
jgi:uncharacterized protein (DUF924 family)